MYRELDPGLIVATADAIRRRIDERFAGSGLSRVAGEILAFAQDAEARLLRLRRPHWPTRIAVTAVIALLAGLLAVAPLLMRVPAEVGGLGDLLQALEAGVNDAIFLGLAVYFLVGLEKRRKRRDALRALHELRSFAHVIDMHQLTKDPEPFLSPEMEATASSPRRTMTRFELARYLDYCSELLSITSKLAALHVQYLNDPVVLSAVNDVQILADGLSGKIWQKLVILDTVALRAGSARPA
jgi:hypothetical protein